MKVAGEAVLHAPVERVWAALRDPAVLVATIPGCERLAATGPDSYDMTVTAGVASIKGSYTGTVSLTDLPEPNTFLMKAAGAGGPGTVSADVTVTLAEAGDGTRLRYDADAVVGGVIGGVGQRMLAGVAKKLAGEFFAAVDDVLTGARAALPVTAPSAGETEAAALPVVYRDAVPGRSVTRPDEPISFILGAVFGAVTALAGVLVGVRVARGGRRLQRRPEDA